MSYKIGNIEFNNPFMNASGCWSMNEEQITELYSNSELSGIVSKTFTLFSKQGNPEPNYYHDVENNIHYNCKGLPNYGYNYYRDLSIRYKEKPFILSMAYDFETVNMVTILKDYDKWCNKETLLEINMSCPNVDKNIPGYNIKIIESLINMLPTSVEKIKIGLKLPPYFVIPDMKEIALLLNKSNTIKYIVLSNSIPNVMPLVNGQKYLSTIYGGMSGKLNKQIALSNVHIFSQYLKKDIAIIGCGGIDTIDDVNDYLNNGASFVQLASCFYEEHADRLNIDKINDLVNVWKSPK